LVAIRIPGLSALRKTDTRAGRFGILCSSLCLLHCSAIPTLLWVLPFLAKQHWLGQPIFHQCSALVCTGIVIQSILPGCKANGSLNIALLAGTGLAMVLTAAFLLPDACCQTTEPEFVPRTIQTSGLATGSFPANLELCSYIGVSSDGIHDTPQPIHLISPMITVDQLQSGLGATNTRRWQMIQPWLPRCGALLLILAHGLSLRVLQRSDRSCCPKSSQTDCTIPVGM